MNRIFLNCNCQSFLYKLQILILVIKTTILNFITAVLTLKCVPSEQVKFYWQHFKSFKNTKNTR